MPVPLAQAAVVVLVRQAAATKPVRVLLAVRKQAAVQQQAEAVPMQQVQQVQQAVDKLPVQVAVELAVQFPNLVQQQAQVQTALRNLCSIHLCLVAIRQGA